MAASAAEPRTPANPLAPSADIFIHYCLLATSTFLIASPWAFFVPTSNNGLSFLGVTFTDAIGRVRITTGNAPLGPNDGGATDVVALDDFI
jgi:hypothetical protein